MRTGPHHLVLAGIVAAALAATGALADRKSTTRPTSSPASMRRVISVADWVKLPLSKRAGILAEARLRQFGHGYVCQIDNKRHVVYISAVDTRHFEHVVKLLSAHMAVQRRMLFPRPLQWNVTVVLPTLAHYRKLTTHAKALGHYQFKTRTLCSISFSDTLVHEFIHAMHHHDMALARQTHPIWLAEGLATLFQRSRFHDGKLEIIKGAGLEVLQKALAQKKAPSLRELLTMNQKRLVAKGELLYPYARYVMFYLYRQGKLIDFYRLFKLRYATDRTGIKALEELLGKGLSDIEADWRKWVLAEKPPWRPRYKLRPHLGVRMQITPEGVRITGFARGSQAGSLKILKINDVIISVAGRPTPTPRELSEAVQACRPGNIVNIEVIRRGRTVVLKHLLGLMPK